MPDSIPAPIDPPLDALVGVDVYLIDQLLKGRIAPGARILDVGCGSGRNLTWFLREGGYSITAVDPNPEALVALAERCAALGVSIPEGGIHGVSIEDAPLEEDSFDLVICNAVLHFARDAAQFDAILEASWRALRPGGLFFARLATTIGIEDRLLPLGGGWYRLPDESDRFLVDQNRLLELSARLRGTLLDPIKTTVVQGMRAMTTWVLEK